MFFSVNTFASSRGAPIFTNNTSKDTLFEAFFGNIDYFFLRCDPKTKESIFSIIVTPNGLKFSHVVWMSIPN